MRNILFRMQKAELEQLRDAIVTQQIKHPFKNISISSILGESEVVQEVVDSLNQAATALGPNGVGAFIDMLYDDACRRSTDKSFELVWTGPEGDGAYNRDTKVVVQQLFDQASKSVLIAGFAFYKAKAMFKEIAKKMDADPSFNITLCLNVHRQYRDTREADIIINEFRTQFFNNDWPGKRRPNIYYDPRSLEIETAKKAQLHAKCVVIDDSVAFVGSANFTDKAQLNNIEAGILINDKEFAWDLAKHFNGLIEAGHLTAL